MSRAIIVLLLQVMCATPLKAQENLGADLRTADAVVVGTLRHDYRFPWLDGWNERGHIEVDQVIKGAMKAGSILLFAWERDFKQGWCLTRPDWRGALDRRGIWLLVRDGDRYRATNLFFGFRDIKHLWSVLQEMRDSQ